MNPTSKVLLLTACRCRCGVGVAIGKCWPEVTNLQLEDKYILELS